MKNIILIITAAFMGLFSSPVIGQNNDTESKLSEQLKSVIDSIEANGIKNLKINEDGIFINFDNDNDFDEEINLDFDGEIDIDIDGDVQIRGNDEEIDGDWEEGDDEDFDWDLDMDSDNDCDDDNDDDCDDEDNFRMLLLDLGMSSFMFDNSLNLPGDLDEFQLKYPGSVNVNLHLFRHRLNFGNSGLHFDYGVSVNWKHYKFENDFKITPNISTLELVPSETTFKSNKLRTTYLELPVSFTYHKRGSKFFISGGAYGFMKIGSSQRIKSENADTEKIKDDFNLRPFGFGLQGRVGFGPLEFYAQYGLENLFNDGITPALTPVTFGIAILGF